jgi:hypothetical protein
MEQHEKMAWMLSSFLSEPHFSATKHIRTITSQLVDNHEMNNQHLYLTADREN